MLADLTHAAGHQQLLKGINRMSLVRHLCTHPGLSRVELAAAVGLTKSTVSTLARELLDEGWLVEREVVATGELGRRPTPLFVDPERKLLLGVEVGIESLRLVLTSLTGEVQQSASVPMTPGRGAKACLGQLSQAMLKLAQRIDTPRQHIIGIGIGLPGGVDEASGHLHFAPNLGWRDVPVGALLGERLAGTALDGVPLFVQNEADVAALGELEFNRHEVADPLLYVSLNEGVGAGVVVGERLLTGHRGFAGEVGHIVLQLNGPPCSCGRRGCAEALIGLRAMLGPQSDDDEQRHLSVLAARVQAGERGTLRAVARSGAYLGVLLQNLAAAYDPGCIVLGGALVSLGDPFLQPALRTLTEHAAAAGLAPPALRISRHGADAVAIGAAALARYRLTRPLTMPALKDAA